MTERQLASIWWDNHIYEYINDLSGYIAFPSIAEEGKDGLPFGRPCLDMLQYMKDLMTRYGLNSKLICDVFASGTVKGERETIAIACHGDVVPVDDKWDKDPFTLYQKEDHLVGRGTTDNKGAGIAVLYAIRYLLESGYKFSHSINLLIGSAEEIGMKDVDIAFPNGNNAILTLVPDSGFPVVYGEKSSLKAEIKIPKKNNKIIRLFGGSGVGVIDEATVILNETKKLDQSEEVLIEGNKITAFGMARHSATPDEGVCALNKLLRFLDKNNIIKDDLKQILSCFVDFHGSGFNLAYNDKEEGSLTLVITKCETVENNYIFTINSRFPSSVDVNTIVNKIKAIFPNINIISTSKGFKTELNTTLYKLNNIANSVYNSKREPYVMAGGTYAHSFKPAIAYGMGSPNGNVAPPFPQGEGRAHQRNESVQISRMKNGFIIYCEALKILDKEL